MHILIFIIFHELKVCLAHATSFVSPQVLEAKVMRLKGTSQSRGFGFVTLQVPPSKYSCHAA